MTVRTWFRIVRRAAWEGSPPPHILLYLRALPDDFRQGPLAPAISLIDFHDYQAFVEKVLCGEGVPLTVFEQTRRAMYTWEYRNLPSHDITS